jgi:predicted anti-sigma-YlaC factor YlaD
MNACREFRELSSLALDEVLGPEDERRLQEHLSGCAACRVFKRDLAQAHRLVRSVEAVEPPPWMAPKIMARIRAETAPRPTFWRRAILPLIGKPQFQVATVLLVCATSYFP